MVRCNVCNVPSRYVNTDGRLQLEPVWEKY
jgi:hypothetical protein